MGRQVTLNDNLDGSYSGRVEFTEDEVDAGAELRIMVNGRQLKAIEPPSESLGFKKWSASFHVGAAIPIGSFADDFDPGVNVLLDLDYHFSPQLSLVGLLGYNAFGSKTAGVDDNYWANFSVNAKYRLFTGALSPYLMGGPGYYIPKEGDSGFGANLGFGIDYDYGNSITLELGGDYHIVFGEDIQFLHSHAGVIFRF